MLFGDKLKLLREEKRISQRELGEKLGISDRVIGYYETNKRFPKDESALISIANFFSVSIDWLIGRTEIRSFKNDGSNILCLEIVGLSQEDIEKIREYATMLMSKNKTF